MRQCTQCGSALVAQARFCTHCGMPAPNGPPQETEATGTTTQITQASLSMQLKDINSNDATVTLPQRKHSPQSPIPTSQLQAEKSPDTLELAANGENTISNNVAHSFPGKTAMPDTPPLISMPAPSDILAEPVASKNKAERKRKQKAESKTGNVSQQKTLEVEQPEFQSRKKREQRNTGTTTSLRVGIFGMLLGILLITGSGAGASTLYQTKTGNSAQSNAKTQSTPSSVVQKVTPTPGITPTPGTTPTSVITPSPTPTFAPTPTPNPKPAGQVVTLTLSGDLTGTFNVTNVNSCGPSDQSYSLDLTGNIGDSAYHFFIHFLKYTGSTTYSTNSSNGAEISLINQIVIDDRWSSQGPGQKGSITINKGGKSGKIEASIITADGLHQTHISGTWACS